MTDYIGEATLKVIDLDALKKLADEATPGDWTTYVSGAPEYNNVTHGIEIGPEGPLVVGAFEREQDCNYVHSVRPATIKALIAELREARGHLARCVELVPEPGAIDAADAFNGKGEG